MNEALSRASDVPLCSACVSNFANSIRLSPKSFHLISISATPCADVNTCHDGSIVIVTYCVSHGPRSRGGNRDFVFANGSTTVLGFIGRA
jgi:hypothetical protein